jgi:putative ABC transport system substrate-binding protein
MKRRNLLLLLATAITAARPLRAQRKAMPVVGILGDGSAGPFAPFVAALHDGLSESGFVEGQNVAFEYRWAEGSYDRLPALSADLIDRKVDVIIAMGGTPSARAAKDATSTIPIVFLVSDPVASGLVASLARPGGNLTGIDMFTLELVTKRFEMLSELVPQTRVTAVLVNLENLWIADGYTLSAQAAASARGLQLHVLKASTESEIDAAFATVMQLHICALIVAADPFLDGRREQLVTLAARDAVPAIYALREFVLAGGLISYGASFPATFRRAGIYAGKILKGAKPTDLPVEQPTTFELVVNLKTAKTLGLTIPPSILARADEVIE